jgi:hypothetical protein
MLSTKSYAIAKGVEEAPWGTVYLNVEIVSSNRHNAKRKRMQISLSASNALENDLLEILQRRSEAK